MVYMSNSGKLTENDRVFSWFSCSDYCGFFTFTAMLVGEEKPLQLSTKLTLQ